MKHQSCTPITHSPGRPLGHPIRGRSLLSLLLLAFLLTPLPPAHAQSGVTRGTFIIAVATDVPPFAVQAENGRLVGFDMDVLRLLVRTAGLRVSYEAVSFTQLIPGVATQLYDAAIGCLVVTEERTALVDFSTPYFTTGKVLVFSENSPPLYDLTDLTPAITLSVMAESAAWRFLTEQQSAAVVPAPSLAAALELAAARVTDGAFVDEIAADRFLRTHPEARLRTVSGLVTTDQCAIAVSKETPRLLLELNAALIRLKNNGKYLATYRRWFGHRPLNGPPPLSRPAPIADARQGTIPVAGSMGSTQNPVPADSAIGAYAVTLATEPSTYQLIELAPNGLWLESLAAPDTDTIQGIAALTTGQLPVQSGRWQAVRAEPMALTVEISATVQFSATTASDAGAPALPLPLRKEYQLTIQDDGTLRGAYTLYTSAAPTITALLTKTIELVGQRVVE